MAMFGDSASSSYRTYVAHLACQESYWFWSYSSYANDLVWTLLHMSKINHPRKQELMTTQTAAYLRCMKEMGNYSWVLLRVVRIFYYAIRIFCCNFTRSSTSHCLASKRVEICVWRAFSMHKSDFGSQDYHISKQEI